jgi:hypothetical protein
VRAAVTRGGRKARNALDVILRETLENLGLTGVILRA